jgi:hypothetical protein
MTPKRPSSAFHVSAAIVGLCVIWESIVELMVELTGNFCLRQPQIGSLLIFCRLSVRISAGATIMLSEVYPAS